MLQTYKASPDIEKFLYTLLEAKIEMDKTEGAWQ